MAVIISRHLTVVTGRQLHFLLLPGYLNKYFSSLTVFLKPWGSCQYAYSDSVGLSGAQGFAFLTNNPGEAAAGAH